MFLWIYLITRHKSSWKSEVRNTWRAAWLIFLMMAWQVTAKHAHKSATKEVSTKFEENMWRTPVDFVHYPKLVSNESHVNTRDQILSSTDWWWWWESMKEFDVTFKCKKFPSLSLYIWIFHFKLVTGCNSCKEIKERLCIEFLYSISFYVKAQRRLQGWGESVGGKKDKKGIKDKMKKKRKIKSLKETF